MIKQTELILQSATKQLVATSTSLQKVMAELAKSVEAIEAQNQLITQNEAKIEELTTRYSEKAREAEVNFSLALKENQKTALDDILKEQGLTSIKNEELETLRKDLETVKNTFSEEVKKSENLLKAEHNAKMESLKNIMDLEKKAEMAELKGKLSSASEKNILLDTQIISLREEIIAMRNAETERVKALSSRDVVINNPAPQR